MVANYATDYFSNTYLMTRCARLDWMQTNENPVFHKTAAFHNKGNLYSFGPIGDFVKRQHQSLPACFWIRQHRRELSSLGC